MSVSAKMTYNGYAIAKEIARHTNEKIRQLQQDFLGNDKGRSTAARAQLAQLRRLGTPGGGGWFLVDADVFADLPEFFLLRHKNERMFKTMCLIMRLYAIHQQSQTAPMAITHDKEETSDEKEQKLHCSFGWSCRQIEPNLDESKGIRSRLAALEAAGTNFYGIEHNVRALITLMRSRAVPVNYYLLAYDLYLLQFYNTREKVLIEWGCDYFKKEKTTEDEATKS